MKRFEYKKVYVHNVEIDDVLNSEGFQGWEAWWGENTKDHGYIIWFKREIFVSEG